jgi:Methyltransferase domain
VSSIGKERERRITWRHRLPREGPLDRHEALVDAVRGRQAVHVGFVDELMASKIAAGVWLHARLAEAAASLVGLDADEQGVEAARREGYEARTVDAQSSEAVRSLALERADIVVAGELIEHLGAPGPFLRAMRELADELVLTTPNAYRLLNFVAPLSGNEYVHPDHTAWHSPATLRRLCENAGWEVTRIAYYRNPERRQVGGTARQRAAGRLANAARLVLGRVNSIRPYWGDGLIVWARLR